MANGGGSRWRAVARAMLTRPEVLLLEEPTEGLDPEAAAAMLTTVRSILQDTTIVAAVHDRGGFVIADAAVVRL